MAGFGIFVTLDYLLIDGMIHVSELGRDYFVYDETRHVLRGERSGQEFRLGQRVSVKIVRADPDALKIDLALADAPPGDAAGAQDDSADREDSSARGQDAGLWNTPAGAARKKAAKPVAKPAARKPSPSGKPRRKRN